MASSAPVLLMFLALFTTIVSSEDCSMFGGKSEWCDSGKFCCGICGFKNFGKPPQMESAPDDVIFPVVIVLILLTSIIVLITCWVCPCCCLHKRLSPRPEIATTTVMTTQYLPQPDIQGGRYLIYQPLPNNPPYGGQPLPIGPFQGQPYQEAAGPGYPVPFSQAPNDGYQAMYPIQPAQPPLPTDYTSPQPAYNPTYMGLLGTTLATAVKTSY